MTDTIICIRWGTAFSSADVNMLYRACRAHVAGDLRFVCLTDNADGLLAEIEARDIPDIGLTEAQIKRPGVWRKLSLFSPELADLGRVLFVDLDMMIVGDLAPFFAATEGATFLNMGASWRPDPTSDERETGTAVFSYDPGAEPQVLEAFLADPEAAMASFQNEQDFVGAHVRQARFWPEGLVVSFKRHLCHRNGLGLFKAPDAPPPDCAIVAFHGDPRPRDTMEKTLWGPAPHWHLGRVDWIDAYWRAFGE